MLFASASTAAGSAFGSPYRPDTDSIVLEELPTPADGTRAELRLLRTRLSSDPTNLDLALDLARRYVKLGRSESDPRYYGYAEAALKPWWISLDVPVDVLVLRAIVHQSRHAFDAALADLGLALKERPNHAQALLTASFVLQSQGKYAEALALCSRLPVRTEPLIVVTCVARVKSLTGEAGRGYDLLRHALDRSPGVETSVRLWALTNLAEVATRTGKYDAAERYFRDALSLVPRDSYLLGAYADFLLDRGRPEEVRDLLENEKRVDGLLLRLALANDQIAEASDEVGELKVRFDAGRRRGNALHLREEARFQLWLLNDPVEALRLATRNWQVQREPWDARLLLEAALSADNPGAARDVLAWIDMTGLEDAEIEDLARRLTQGPV